jgi:predicted transcriptional regulator
MEDIKERNTEDYLAYIKVQIDFIYDKGFDIKVRPSYMKESAIKHNLSNMVIYSDQSIESISKYLAGKIVLIELLEKKDKLPTDRIISYLESKSDKPVLDRMNELN